MADTKEPGQTAFEVDQSCIEPEARGTWDDLLPWAKKHWARIEAAVLEKAARIAAARGDEWLVKAKKERPDSCGEAVLESAGSAGHEIAAAIRAAKEGQDE